jgi:hypothetical protein
VKLEYPKIALPFAVDRVRIIRKKLGNGFYTRDQVLEALKYTTTSGRGNDVLSSLSMYGLLDKDSQGYYLTPLTDKILNNSRLEKWRGLEESLSKPNLYLRLLADYSEKELKNLDHIPQKYGLPENKRKKNMGRFKQSFNWVRRIREQAIFEPISEMHVSPLDFSDAAIDIKAGNLIIELKSGLKIDVPPEIIYRAVINELANNSTPSVKPGAGDEIGQGDAD